MKKEHDSMEVCTEKSMIDYSLCSLEFIKKTTQVLTKADVLVIIVSDWLKILNLIAWAEKRTSFKPKTPMVRQRGRKDSQTPSTKSMPNNSNLDYKRKLTTISLSPRIDRKFNTKSRSPSYDKMEIISIGTEEIEKDEIRKISTSSKPSLSPVNEGMFFFSLCIILYLFKLDPLFFYF